MDGPVMNYPVHVAFHQGSKRQSKVFLLANFIFLFSFSCKAIEINHYDFVFDQSSLTLHRETLLCHHWPEGREEHVSEKKSRIFSLWICFKTLKLSGPFLSSLFLNKFEQSYPKH